MGEEYRSDSGRDYGAASPASAETPTSASELRIALLPTDQEQPAAEGRTRLGRWLPSGAEIPTPTAELNIRLLSEPPAQSRPDGQKAPANQWPAVAESPSATSQLTLLLLADAQAQLATEVRKTQARGRWSTIAAVIAGAAVVAAATIAWTQGTSRQVTFIVATLLVATLGTAVGFFLSLRRKQSASLAIGDLSVTLLNELPATTPSAASELTVPGEAEEHDD